MVLNILANGAGGPAAGMARGTDLANYNAIDIEKSTNGVDADTANAAAIVNAGAPITWTYEVTNTGNVAFAENGVTVTDDQGLVPVLDTSTDAGSDGILSPGETWVYTASGTAANLNTIVDFEQFTAGTQTSAINAGLPGLTVSTANSNGLMIFNANGPTGGDLDLGTPNEDFGGPGIGTGGGAGTPGENPIPLGSVLVLSESGSTSDPDDNAGGGTITFAWDSPVRLNQVGILDIDTNEVGGTLVTYGANGAVLGSYALAALGNNSYQTILIEDVGVSRMDVTFVGSGAVAELNYDNLYTNLGSVTAGNVTDSDPSNYFNGFSGPIPPQPQGENGGGGTHGDIEVGLFNADTDQLITLLGPEGTQVQKSAIDGLNLTIAAFVPGASGLNVKSMRFNLNGGARVMVENVEPYALFGDNSGNFNGGYLPLGANSLALDLFSEDNAKGSLLGQVALDFTVVA